MPYIKNSVAYDHDFWYTFVKWYLQVSSFFGHFQFLGYCRGKRAKKTQNDNKFCLTLYLRNCILGTVSHMVRVLHLCKMMIYPAIFFHYFKILIFQVFQVNANRKFWGVCAPPSSHVCNFLWIGLTSGNKVLKKQLFHLGIAYAVLTLYNYSFP